MNEQSRISELKGIGEKTEKLFQKMGVYTIGDLLRYYPRGYDVYEEPVSVGELEEGKVQAVGCSELATLFSSPLNVDNIASTPFAKAASAFINP